jgi:DnaJ-class molecular chaperone
MRHRTLFTAALVLGLAVGLIAAQDKPQTKTAVGAVTKIAGTMLVVDVGKTTMQFITNASTDVTVKRGTRQTVEKKLEGKGIKITEVVQQGDQVSVKYTEADGKLTAVSVDVLQERPPAAQPQK